MKRREKPVVCVVDDEGALRTLTRRILEFEGYDVIEARDGAEAIAVVQHAGRVDLIVTDVNMPAMDGRSMARCLTDWRVGLKVLFVTGRLDMLFADGRPLPANQAVVEKPFTGKALLNAASMLLFGHLDGPNLQEEEPDRVEQRLVWV